MFIYRVGAEEMKRGERECSALPKFKEVDIIFNGKSMRQSRHGCARSASAGRNVG